MGKRLLSFGATVLLHIIKFFILIKRFLTAFFVFLLRKPLAFIFDKIVVNVIVKIYRLYFGVLKKLGWSKSRDSIFTFVFNQKMVHVLVVLITILLVFINTTTKTKAGGLTERAHKTILADLIKGEFSDFEEDEQLIIETFDKESTITPLQQTYLDNLTSVKVQSRVTMKGIDEDEDLFINDKSNIVKPDLATTQKSIKPRTETETYTVQGGDTISTIAEKFGISVSTILWENGLSAYSIIRPGDSLVILPVSGIAHKVASGETIGSIAKKYNAEEIDILEINKLASADQLQINQNLIVPGGRKETVSYQPETYTGISAIKEIAKAPSATPVAGNKMNWPTEGSRITQYYSWKHYGLDIANKIGTPIYAADSGTIETIGWGTGYGNQIVIDHGGGKKTRYAHMSKFYVEKGDKVTKGQTIGAMGSTGWSTGPHLHFEVIINGTKYNPLNYIQ